MEKEADACSVKISAGGLVGADLPRGCDLKRSQRLADHYAVEHARAEAAGLSDEAAKLEVLLKDHDRGRHASYLAGEGVFSLGDRFRRARPPNSIATSCEIAASSSRRWATWAPRRWKTSPCRWAATWSSCAPKGGRPCAIRSRSAGSSTGTAYRPKEDRLRRSICRAKASWTPTRSTCQRGGSVERRIRHRDRPAVSHAAEAFVDGRVHGPPLPDHDRRVRRLPQRPGPAGDARTRRRRWRRGWPAVSKSWAHFSSTKTRTVPTSSRPTITISGPRASRLAVGVRRLVWRDRVRPREGGALRQAIPASHGVRVGKGRSRRRRPAFPLGRFPGAYLVPDARDARGVSDPLAGRHGRSRREPVRRA